MLSNQTLSPHFVFYGTATLFLEIIYSLVTSAKREAILFLFGCSEVNSTWLITFELANQRARKTLFTCVVYTISSCVRDSLGSLCHKPEAFEISRMFVNMYVCMYVCMSPNLPRFRGPGIEVLKFYSTRVERFRKKNYRWK